MHTNAIIRRALNIVFSVISCREIHCHGIYCAKNMALITFATQRLNSKKYDDIERKRSGPIITYSSVKPLM